MIVVFFVDGVVFGSVFFGAVVVDFVVVGFAVVVIWVTVGGCDVAGGADVAGDAAAEGDAFDGVAVVKGDVVDGEAVCDEPSCGFAVATVVVSFSVVSGVVIGSGAVVTSVFTEAGGICSCTVSDVCGDKAGVSSSTGTADMLPRTSPAGVLAYPKKYPIIKTLKSATERPAIIEALRGFLGLYTSVGGASLPSSVFIRLCRAFFISVAVENLSLGSNAQALRMISAISVLASRGGVSFSPLILFINAV